MSRSIAGQIEHWMKLGQALEAVASIDEVRSVAGIKLVGSIDAIKQGYRDRFIKALSSGKVKPDNGFVAMRSIAAGSSAAYRDVDFG